MPDSSNQKQTSNNPLSRPKPNFWKIGFFVELVIILLLSTVIYFENNSGFSNQQALTPTPASDLSETKDWKTYKDTEYGFEFQYPPSLGTVIKENNTFKANSSDLTIFARIGNIEDYEQWVEEEKDKNNDFNQEKIIAGKKSFLGERMSAEGIFEAYTLIPINDESLLYLFINIDTKNTKEEAPLYQKARDLRNNILSTFKFTEGEKVCKTIIIFQNKEYQYCLIQNPSEEITRNYGKLLLDAKSIIEYITYYSISPDEKRMFIAKLPAKQVVNAYKPIGGEIPVDLLMLNFETGQIDNLLENQNMFSVFTGTDKDLWFDPRPQFTGKESAWSPDNKGVVFYVNYEGIYYCSTNCRFLVKPNPIPAQNSSPPFFLENKIYFQESTKEPPDNLDAEVRLSSIDWAL